MVKTVPAKRRQYLDEIGSYSPGLLEQVQRKKLSTRELNKIVTFFRAGKEASCTPDYLAPTITDNLDKFLKFPDIITEAARKNYNARFIAYEIGKHPEAFKRNFVPLLKKTEQAGYDPHKLLWELIQHSSSSTLSPKAQRPVSSALNKMLDAKMDPSSLAKDLSRRSPSFLSTTLPHTSSLLVSTKKANHVLTSHLIDTMEEHPAAFKKQHYIKLLTEVAKTEEPWNLACATAGKIESFPKSKLRLIHPTLMSIAKNGQDPRHLIRGAGSLIQSRRISDKDLQDFIELRESMPKDFSHTEVLDHASKVSKKIPASEILEYQKRILKEGHFPTAGLVEAMHKVHLKDVRKRRKLQTPKRRKPRL